MDIAFEHEIRRRAYEIWTACGMNDGEAEHHWLSAEHAVRSEAGAAKTASAKTGPVKASRAKAKAAAPVSPTNRTKPKTEPGKAPATKAAVVKAAKSKTKTAPAHRAKASMEAVL